MTGAHDGKNRSEQQDDANRKEHKKIFKAMADSNKSFRQTMLAERDGQAPAGGKTAAEDTAGDVGSAAQNPLSTAVQAQPAGSPKNYTIPRHTPDRPAALGGSDDARASRSRDEKTTDGQPAEQQQRSGTHPPHGLAAALALAADTVQNTIGQAQQNIDMANAMQHAVAPPALMFNQQQNFHPPPGCYQQQYPQQSISIASAMQHAAAPPTLMFNQQQSFHPPPGSYQNQYPIYAEQHGRKL